jgi:hypothetical protein
VVLVLVPVLASCSSFRYAVMRTSRVEDQACLQACTAAPSSGDRAAVVDCVARCPGALVGNGECDALTLHADDACVDAGHRDAGRVVFAGFGVLVGFVLVAWIALAVLIPHGIG